MGNNMRQNHDDEWNMTSRQYYKSERKKNMKKLTSPPPQFAWMKLIGDAEDTFCAPDACYKCCQWFSHLNSMLEPLSPRQAKPASMMPAISTKSSTHRTPCLEEIDSRPAVYDSTCKISQRRALLLAGHATCLYWKPVNFTNWFGIQCRHRSGAPMLAYWRQWATRPEASLH